MRAADAHRMAAELWASGAPAEWVRLRAECLDIVATHPKPELGPLERWVWEELPQALAGRDPPYMTAAELVKLVDWWASEECVCLHLAFGGGRRRRRRHCAARACAPANGTPLPCLTRPPFPNPLLRRATHPRG